MGEANEPNAQAIERHAGSEQSTGAEAVHNVAGERLQKPTQPDIRGDDERNRFSVRPQIGNNGFEKTAHRRARTNSHETNHTHGTKDHPAIGLLLLCRLRLRHAPSGCAAGELSRLLDLSTGVVTAQVLQSWSTHMPIIARLIAPSSSRRGFYHRMRVYYA